MRSSCSIHVPPTNGLQRDYMTTQLALVLLCDNCCFQYRKQNLTKHTPEVKDDGYKQGPSLKVENKGH